LDDRPVPVNMACHAGRESRLRFGRRANGARAYLSVAGGIDVPAVLGSRSTDLASGLGGLGGRPVEGGDQLPVARRSGRPAVRGSVALPVTLPTGGAMVRVLLEPDADRCSPLGLQVFRHTRFIVGPESNRMGYRLQGPSVELAAARPLLSSATPVGTVQVPPSGQPILLMADRQTTGGYAKVATAISADLPVAGQLAPGDWIAFRECTYGEAAAAMIALEQKLQELHRTTRVS
jgi:biotin-dependent carboxylase-like uncharacterized protein